MSVSCQNCIPTHVRHQTQLDGEIYPGQEGCNFQALWKEFSKVDNQSNLIRQRMQGSDIYTTLSNHYSGITLPPKAYCKVNCLY
jgi:hypothetical protein